MWKRGEIFSSFPHYFVYIFLTSGVKLHIHLLNVVIQFIVFLTFNSELRLSRNVSVSPLEFEITGVDCILLYHVENYRVLRGSYLIPLRRDIHL